MLGAAAGKVRAEKAGQLVNSAAVAAGETMAYVEMVYLHDDGKEVKFRRTINLKEASAGPDGVVAADRGTVYSVNGTKKSWAEYEKTLAALGIFPKVCGAFVECSLVFA